MNTWCQKVFFCYILIHPHDHNELKKKSRKIYQSSKMIDNFFLQNSNFPQLTLIILFSGMISYFERHQVTLAIAFVK